MAVQGGLLGALAAVAVSAAAATVRPGSCPIAVVNNSCWYCPGANVVRSFQTGSWQPCCAACAAEPKCKAFTYNRGDKGGTCFLKDGHNIQKNRNDCVSGGTIFPPDPVPPPPPPPPAPPGAKSVLLMLVDDLRPELGAYGSHVPTPRIDEFAKTATTFTNAYVQYSFCCPSRNSFMSGRRPSSTKVWNFIDNFREAGIGADWVSMPEFFKVHGYFTHGLGKLFHPGSPPNSDPPSWSDPSRVSDGAGQVPVVPGVFSSFTSAVEMNLSAVNCITGEHGGSYCEIDGDVGPDDGLMHNCVDSLALLTNYTKSSGHPFFLGCGFHKPHIPWTIPKRFFDPLAPIENTALPKHERPPENMPPIAWNKGLGRHALDSYSDANAFPLHSFSNGSWVSFPHNQTKAMRRGYYAAVSYLDWMVGNVLDALDSTGTASSVAVVLMGDHGYNLGELNLWCKMTVFESGVRVPLFIRAPWLSPGGQRTTSLAEAVDLFPTLVELAGVATSVPDYCQGSSLVPVMKNVSAEVKQGAFSEFVKCYSCCRVPDSAPCQNGGPGGRCAPADPIDLHEMGNCFHVPRDQIDFIGYSVRTKVWRYTEWLHFDNNTLHGDFNRKVATELYAHVNDDSGAHDWDGFENQNFAADPSKAAIVAEHAALLRRGFPGGPG